MLRTQMSKYLYTCVCVCVLVPSQPHFSFTIINLRSYKRSMKGERTMEPWKSLLYTSIYALQNIPPSQLGALSMGAQTEQFIWQQSWYYC